MLTKGVDYDIDDSLRGEQPVCMAHLSVQMMPRFGKLIFPVIRRRNAWLLYMPIERIHG